MFWLSLRVVLCVKVTCFYPSSDRSCLVTFFRSYLQIPSIDRVVLFRLSYVYRWLSNINCNLKFVLCLCCCTGFIHSMKYTILKGMCVRARDSFANDTAVFNISPHDWYARYIELKSRDAYVGIYLVCGHVTCTGESCELWLRLITPPLRELLHFELRDAFTFSLCPLLLYMFKNEEAILWPGRCSCCNG